MSDIILKAVEGTDAYTVTLPQSVTGGRCVRGLLTGRRSKYETVAVFLVPVADTLIMTLSMTTSSSPAISQSYIWLEYLPKYHFPAPPRCPEVFKMNQSKLVTSCQHACGRFHNDMKAAKVRVASCCETLNSSPTACCHRLSCIILHARVITSTFWCLVLKGGLRGTETYQKVILRAVIILLFQVSFLC